MTTMTMIMMMVTMMTVIGTRTYQGKDDDGDYDYGTTGVNRFLWTGMIGLLRTMVT